MSAHRHVLMLPYLVCFFLLLPGCGSEDPPPRLLELPTDLSLPLGDSQTLRLTLHNPGADLRDLQLDAPHPSLDIARDSLVLPSQAHRPVELTIDCTGDEGAHRGELIIDSEGATLHVLSITWTCQPHHLSHVSVGPHHPIADLATALRAAKDGATIELHPGLYALDAPLIIDRPLHLKAATDQPPTITTFSRHGAFVIAPGAALRLQDLQLRAAAGGRAPAIDALGDLWLQDITIADGHTLGDAAALRTHRFLLAHNLDLRHNRAPLGATLHHRSGHAHLRHASTTHHEGRLPAIINDAALTLSHTSLSHNVATHGAAIHNRGRLSLRASIMDHNQSQGIDSYGAAFYQSAGRAHLSHVLIRHNHATFGAALTVDEGLLQVDHITVSDNAVDAGNPVLIGHPATLRAANSVFAGDDNTFLSVDVIDGAQLISEGGNLVTHPGFAWPDVDTPTPDRLPTSSQPLEWASHEASDDDLSDPPSPHQRHHIPAHDCRDPNGVSIDRSHPTSHQQALFCEPGAHLTYLRANTP